MLFGNLYTEVLKYKRGDVMGKKIVFVVFGLVLALGMMSSVYILKTHNNEIGSRKDQTISKAYNNDKTNTSVSNKQQTKTQNEEATSTQTNDMPQGGGGIDISKAFGASFLAFSMVFYFQSKKKSFDL